MLIIFTGPYPAARSGSVGGCLAHFESGPTLKPWHELGMHVRGNGRQLSKEVGLVIPDQNTRTAADVPWPLTLLVNDCALMGGAPARPEA